ncbi:hypothetical protein AZOA_06800 [Azoarcus sp. Aa7]|nr:hypothetical protein [Azoarcus sp. Aa7]
MPSLMVIVCVLPARSVKVIVTGSSPGRTAALSVTTYVRVVPSSVNDGAASIVTVSEELVWSIVSFTTTVAGPVGETVPKSLPLVSTTETGKVSASM